MTGVASPPTVSATVTVPTDTVSRSFTARSPRTSNIEAEHRTEHEHEPGSENPEE
jgi:hypothetical protein